MDEQPTTVNRTGEWMPVTTSGAHLECIGPELAAGFLARLYEPAPESINVALGAFEDNGKLIGVAVLGASTLLRATATVAISPDRRRLKVGSDLLCALLRQAHDDGVRYLVFSHPAAGPLEELVRSLGLAMTRRVHQGRTTIAVLVPSEL
jgi:hypothetical protein